MRSLLVSTLTLVVGCSSPAPTEPDAGTSVDAEVAIDAPSVVVDGATGFGTLSGAECGAIELADITGSTPRVVRITFDFAREYLDPQDRPLLTSGGLKLAETPNAGGSSVLSEVFAFEQLGRCEGSMLLKTETEIVYDTTSKKTDLLITLEGHKVGVSVVRAFQFPLETPLSLTEATRVMTKKLEDIPLSSASVSAGDRWTKQFLSVLAFDAAAADTIVEAWSMLSDDLKGDTIIVLTTTNGSDTFIYTQ